MHQQVAQGRPQGQARHAAGAPGAVPPRDPRSRTAVGRPGGPSAPRPALRPIVIIPAHGGAGATTLAGLLRRELASDPAGLGWRVDITPALPDGDPGQLAAARWLRVPPVSVPVIIAARGTAEGARRAVIAVTVLERRGLWPAAIALVADGAGPEPRQAGQRLDLVDGRAGPAVRVPFTAALRAGGRPESIRLPRRLRDAVIQLLALTVAGAGAGQPGQSC